MAGFFITHEDNMAKTLTGTATIDITGAFNNTTTDATTRHDFKGKLKHVWEIANGTTNSKADLFHSATFSLAQAATLDTDLSGGAADAFGANQTFVEVNGIYVHNDSASADNLQLGGAGANDVPIFGAIADFLIIPPNGSVLWIAENTGITVTAGTGDILRLEHDNGSATAITGVLAVWGRSA